MQSNNKQLIEISCLAQALFHTEGTEAQEGTENTENKSKRMKENTYRKREN